MKISKGGLREGMGSKNDFQNENWKGEKRVEEIQRKKKYELGDWMVG
jgi:hypothetical protein